MTEGSAINMNPFRFTALRWQLFIACLMLFFVLPFVPLLVGGVGLLPFVFNKDLLYLLQLLLFFWFGVVLSHFFAVPGEIFRGPLFEFSEEFGWAPQGIPGWTAVILFYVLLAFLLSWPGNLKKELGR